MTRKIDSEKVLFLFIDFQEKLIKIAKNSLCEETAQKLATTAKTLDIPTIVTLQYRKGLGETIASVADNLPEKTIFFDKTSFSALKEENFLQMIESTGKKQIIISGIESHICVLQTALDLLSHGFDVFVVDEACESRDEFQKQLAFERLKQNGAFIVSFEMVLFELLKSSKHSCFKQLQALIK